MVSRNNKNETGILVKDARKIKKKKYLCIKIIVGTNMLEEWEAPRICCNTNTDSKILLRPIFQKKWWRNKYKQYYTNMQ